MPPPTPRPATEGDWSALFDALDAGVVVQDRETRVLYANAMATRLLGLDEQRLTQMTSFDGRWDLLRADGSIFPFEELPAPTAVRTGLPVRDVLVGVAKPQGDRSWLLVTAVPTSPGPDGLPGRFVVTLRDVTALRRGLDEAASALNDGSRLYASVLRAMAEGVVIHEGTGAIRYNNPAAERILGLSAEQLRGLEAVDPRWKLVKPDGAPLGPDEIPSEITRKTGQPCRGVPVGVDWGGTRRSWVAVSTEPIPGEGNLVVATFTDITRERQAIELLEESTARLSAVADAVPGIIYQYLLDTQGKERFTFLRGRSQMLGASTSEELLRDPVRAWSMILPEDAQRFRESLQRSARDLGPVFEELRVNYPTGQRWVRLHATPVRSAAGTLWTGVILDISEEKRLSESLQRTQRREAMGDLAAGVAHNFNNMLAVVLPGLEALRGRVPDPENELADSIQAVQRAAELVRQLMYFARGDTGQTPSQRIQLAVVVDEVVGLCRRTFDRGITLDVDLAARDATTEGTVSHLQQVVLNLLLNSRDALQGVQAPRIRVRLVLSPGPVPGQLPGEPHARLAGRPPHEPAAHHCTLEISDNGRGMDEATQRRLGEPFFTTKAPGKGTGLGLATVLGTLRNMRAGFELHSAPGEGTRFLLHFPARAPEAPRPPGEPPKAQATAARVLVVDDEPLVRRTLKRVLESVKMTVTEAENGERALEALAAAPGQIDVMVLDLSMPGLTGAEVLLRAKTLYPRLPVLVLSGDLGAQAPPGAAAALQKPVLLRELQAAIAKALSNR
jgi:hypothetical protein